MKHIIIKVFNKDMSFDELSILNSVGNIGDILQVNQFDEYRVIPDDTINESIFDGFSKSDEPLKWKDLGLYEFRRQLEYKCQFYGRQLVIIDRFYPSSKTCHECRYKNSKLTLNDREWICPVCGKHIDRDYNAALNILDEGLKQIL